MSENVSTEESGHRPFGELSLSPAMLANLGQLEYIAMTPIQAASLPLALAGNDLIAQAKTGSGKTAAFGLALLNRLNTSRFAVQAMVLCPTRELADQVTQEIRRLARFEENIKVLSLVGGSTLRNQANSLENGVHIVVGTPGRIMDHMERGYLKLDELNTLVLDEADRMLDMGFIRDIRKIIALLPKQRQNLMFSATFSPDIRELAAGLLSNPASVDVAARNTAAETVTQRVIETDREKKKELLCHLFQTRGWHQVLVFARTKHGADALSRNLEKAGIKSAALHGNKSQGARTRALGDFKDGKLVALVATDIAARGIDVDGVSHVVNFDLPNIPETYVHRIGRTARAGADAGAPPGAGPGVITPGLEAWLPRPLAWAVLVIGLAVPLVLSLDGLGLLGFRSVLDRDYPVVFANLYIFNAIITFLITLTVLYFVFVVPMNAYRKRTLLRILGWYAVLVPSVIAAFYGIGYLPVSHRVAEALLFVLLAVLVSLLTGLVSGVVPAQRIGHLPMGVQQARARLRQVRREGGVPGAHQQADRPARQQQRLVVGGLGH